MPRNGAICDCEVGNLPLCSRVLMTARFVIPVKDFERCSLDVREALPSDWLAKLLGDTDVEATPGVDGDLQALLSLTGRDVVVRGTVRASVRLPCARCLQQTDVPVEGELSLLLVPGKAPVVGVGDAKDAKETKDKGGKPSKKGKRGAKDDDEGHLFDAGDADLDTYVGDEVVLDPFVREAILLEVPIFPLCSEACPGIGPASAETTGTTSEEDAVDPRLAPLLELKKKTRV